MLFDLTNTPASFQAYINKAMSEFLDLFCIIYLDDILIYSKSWEEHIQHVSKVLQKLQEFNLYIKLLKCKFFQYKLTFLRFKVRENSVAMETEYIKAIVDWPVLMTVKEI